MRSLRKKTREHPLDEWLSFEQDAISKFKKTSPDLWKFFGECINLARAIPYAISQQDGLTEIEMHTLFLWQKVLHYQVQSLFLLLQSQLDSGYALLRLAAELSRDVFCIANSEKMLSVWIEREIKPKDYRKYFKFSLNSPDEKAVYNTYKFASRFGVHGHMTDAMLSEVIGSIDKNNTMVSLGVSNYGVLDAVHNWMMSFLPMHHLCARLFITKYFAIRPEIFLTLRDYEVTMSSVIQAVSARLADLKKPTN